jgi:hypothetical protein
MNQDSSGKDRLLQERSSSDDKDCSDEEDNEDDDDDDDDDDRRASYRTLIDWSRGRCFHCARRGQLGRDCRHCGAPEYYRSFQGVCPECDTLGLVFEECTNCEDRCLPHLAFPPLLPLDPDEPEEATDSDSEFSTFKEVLHASDAEEDQEN